MLFSYFTVNVQTQVLIIFDWTVGPILSLVCAVLKTAIIIMQSKLCASNFADRLIESIACSVTESY